MSESVKVNQNIRRNTNDFSFADRLGSFINNFEFSRGYDDFSQNNPTNKAYLWNVLSNIGNDYAQEIYQNVLNYIDNAANVDLCKVKALKSMADILGIRYQIFDNIDDIPLEVLQTLDILSINKRYLLDSKVFCKEFREELSTYSGMMVEDNNNVLSNELCSSFTDPSTGEQKCLSDFTEVSTYIDFNNNDNVLEESYYGEFLINVYQKLLNHFVYLQYADVENGISNAQYDYIYQYIANKLVGIQSTSDEVVQDQYDKTIANLKIKYKIGKNFDESAIVDNIERDIDSLDNYDTYEQEILEVEIKRRTDTYLSDSQKPYSDEQRTLGNNVTRFSYYRERKVIEYFNFIQNTYNNLITAADIESAVEENPSKIISVYDKDHNYFNLNQGESSKLLTYDRDSQDITIDTNMIQMIVQLLAQQTLELTEIREQLKIQMQRTYMKGTFLLLSYAINEYLKYNIANKYGDKIYTKDGATSLRDFIEKALQDKNNVELIEYNDATQYYNIENEDVDMSAVNSKMVNSRFWDSDLGKIGEVTKDLPLDEISAYYIHHLHLDKYNVSDTAEFLSIIFEFGANNSFLSTSTPLCSDQFYVQLSDFMCQLPDETYIHDPEVEISNNDMLVLSTDKLHELVDQYVSAGYELSSQTIDKQVSRLSSYISSYYADQLREKNSQTEDDYNARMDDSDEKLIELSDEITTLCNDFIGLSSSSVYSIYLKKSYLSGDYHIEPAYIKNQISTLSNAVLCEISGIDFDDVGLSATLKELSDQYLGVKNDFYDVTLKLSVNTYWPTYTTQKSNEITVQTQKLVNFLNTKSDSIATNNTQHLQTHLDKLISYKNDVNNMNMTFAQTSALYDAFELQVFGKTNTSKSGGSKTFDVWIFTPIYTYDSSGEIVYYIVRNQQVYFDTYQRETITWDEIPDSMPLPDKLSALQKRCEIQFYTEPTIGYFTSDKYGGKVDTEQLTYHYDPSTKYQKWSDAWSAETRTTIMSNLNQLINDFDGVLKLINIELKCLGSQIGEISITDVTISNIGDKLKQLFTELIEKIKNLTPCVNGVSSLTSDAIISSSIIKTDIISALLDSKAVSANIAFIDNNFYDIKTRYTNLKNDNSDFFNGFYGVEGNLDSQIQAMMNFIKDTGLDAKTKLLEKLQTMYSTHDGLLQNAKDFAKTLYATIVTGVTEDDEYTLSDIQYKSGSQIIAYQYVDELVEDAHEWVSESKVQFNNTLSANLDDHCVKMKDYLFAKQLIDTCYSFMINDLSSTSFITIRLDQLKDKLNERSQYIQDNSELFYTQRDIFQQYSGTSIGDDPYYNHINMTHASYQIHPYLYNFVEKSNLSYPIANSFHLAFTANYEQELVNLGLDEIIGKYGNIINLWKSDLYDWSGYRSKYETQTNVSDQSNKESPVAGFTGLFYPPALEEFLDNPDVFIMKTQDNDPDSYYYHLNLTDDQLAKIADQLRTYQDQIRVIAQRVKVEDELVEPALSSEFDIYKYGEDVYGNSIILLKSYAHLYLDHASDPTYRPSFNDKKNTTGELWMRIKDHPLAFPAFDRRKGYEDVSQYNILEEVNKKGKKLNDYVARIDDDYANNNFQDETDKSVLKSTVPNQYLRCFYDMEFDTTNRALLLNMAYQSGTDGKMLSSANLMSYANSSVLVATLHQQFDYNQNMTIYSFAEDSDSSTDNIANPQMFNTVPTTPSEDDIKYDFMGFIRSDTYVYATFIKKQYKKNESTGVSRWVFPYNRAGQPQISIKPIGYKYATKLYKPTSDVAVTDALYNIFDKSKVGDRQAEFYGADNVVITTDKERITIAYISDQVQPVTVKTDIETENEPYNKNNSTIINYAEYTPVVEDKSVSAYGQCTSYPRSTAVLQTEDDAHDIVYNSFDSFTSYLVTLNFKFSGHALKYTGAKYYNLNTDIGFMPLFADEEGKTRFYMNKSLSATDQLNLQLQGPEKAEENATPVIVTPKDEKYGRVTEDYVEYTKFNAYNETALSVLPNQTSASYVFELSTVLSSVYDDIKETNQLVTYKYMLMNSKYASVPIVKGVLGSEDPTGYYYNGYEEFDLLSGQELIGPNGVSYQDVGATNHINNISSIDVKTIIDSNTMVPKAISLTCNVRQKVDSLQVIDINTFKLLVYNQNSLKSYDYYHLLQNSNLELSSILNEQLSGAPGLKDSLMEEIDFTEISALSDYTIPGTTIQPFLSVSTSGDPKYNTISALLEFKYSEENTINAEFPYIDSKDIEDDVTVVANDTQYIYYFALDSFDNIQTDIFTMKKYDVASQNYITIDVNTRSRKYKTFFDKALTIEATYNVEVIDESLQVGDPGYYGNVLYFNYKDYTDTPYVSCDYRGYQHGVPPSWKYYDADSEEIKHTYLRLLPGQTGRLDILIDYLEFDKVDPSSITQTVVGKESRVIASYYIMNVSQDKPKFKISKYAFS